MAKFKSSDFRHKCEFSCKSGTVDDYGVEQVTWSPSVTVGARLVQLSMRDVVAAGIESSVQVLRVTVPMSRSTHRINQDDRVSIRGIDYDIHLVDNFDFNSSYITFVVRSIR